MYSNSSSSNKQDILKNDNIKKKAENTEFFESTTIREARRQEALKIKNIDWFICSIKII
jgi:hypothetical protein